MGEKGNGRERAREGEMENGRELALSNKILIIRI